MISGTLSFDAAGSHTATVTVSDGSLSGNTSFSWTIANTNRAPVFDDQSFSVDENSAGGTVIGTFGATDPDGDVLAYSITSTLPDPEIIDDGDSGFSAGGDYEYFATPSIVGYQTDWHRVQSGNTGEAIWTFTGLSNSSQYTVSATWTSKSNRANDAVYTIGWGDFGGDAGGPSLPDPVIIDDGDSGFSSDFDYLANPALAGYETDWHRKKAGEGAGEASWTFSSLQSGTYNVYATWTHKSNRADDAPYTLEYDGNSEQTSVNQIAQPSNDHTEGGRKFQNLWTVEVTGGTLTVKLNESANGSGQVIADAIRVECTALTDDSSDGAVLALWISVCLE